MEFKEKIGRIKKKIDIRFGCEMSWTGTDWKDFSCKKLKKKEREMIKGEKGTKESGLRKSEKKKRKKR